MLLTDLPTELVHEIVGYGLDDMDTILCLVSTCRYLCLTLWPMYAATRWERFRKVLKNPNLVKLAVDENEDSDDEDSDEYETDSDEHDSSDDHENEKTQAYHAPRSTEDPFNVAYARATIYLDAEGAETHKLLRSFVKRVLSIDSLILDFGSSADIHNLVAMLDASVQMPDLELTIRGGRLTGHGDWQSGPFNPLPAVPEGETKNPEDYAYALRRPRTVDLFLSSSAPRMSSLIIEADAMFISSMYPITLQLLTLAPLTSLTFQRPYLDAFNWSQILPEISLPQLEDLAFVNIEVVSEDLIQFLRRHPNITNLDLTHTQANAMTLRLLINFDLPHLETLRADPSYLIPLLQTHIMGRFQALCTVAVTFPARMSIILRSMPKDIPLELEDLTFRDLDDFYSVYASLMRCTKLTTIELETLRHNGFVEWVLSSAGRFVSPRNVQQIVMTDGDLLIRRGTVLPLAQWMSKNCPTWQVGRVSKFSLPTDPTVEEMVRTFFTVVFPGMVSLQYKMIP